MTQQNFSSNRHLDLNAAVIWLKENCSLIMGELKETRNVPDRDARFKYILKNKNEIADKCNQFVLKFLPNIQEEASIFIGCISDALDSFSPNFDIRPAQKCHHQISVEDITDEKEIAFDRLKEIIDCILSKQHATPIELDQIYILLEMTSDTTRKHLETYNTDQKCKPIDTPEAFDIIIKILNDKTFIDNMKNQREVFISSIKKMLQRMFIESVDDNSRMYYNTTCPTCRVVYNNVTHYLEWDMERPFNTFISNTSCCDTTVSTILSPSNFIYIYAKPQDKTVYRFGLILSDFSLATYIILHVGCGKQKEDVYIYDTIIVCCQEKMMKIDNDNNTAIISIIDTSALDGLRKKYDILRCYYTLSKLTPCSSLIEALNEQIKTHILI